MEAAARLRAGLRVLLAFQLVATFAAVALLGRMSPAVEQILRENVRSLDAVEDMALALDAGDGAAFEEALGRARANVTEEGERAPLAALDASWGAALAGREEDRAAALRALAELGEINRRSMAEADEEAKRLGSAGAWAMVAIGIAGYATSVFVLRRTTRQLLDPLGQVVEVVRAVRGGDPHRRVTPTPGTGELEEIARALNELLDARVRQRPPGAEVEREALGWLLDQRGDPVVLVSTEHEVLATSRAALRLLLGAEGVAWRDALRSRDPERVKSWDLLPGGRAAFVVLGRAGERA